MYIRMLINIVFKFRVVRINGINLNCVIDNMLVIYLFLVIVVFFFRRF